MTALTVTGRDVDPPLPAALVSAYVSAGRAVMPTGRDGRPRTEEVREALTRLVVDPAYLFRHRAGIRAALRAYGVALPLPEDRVPLPDYDDAEVAAHGLANIADPDRLAALALDPAGFEGLDQLLNEEIPAGQARPKSVGDWYRDARAKWPTETSPPQWLLDKVSKVKPTSRVVTPAASTSVATTKPGRWFWVKAAFGAVAVAAGVAGVGSYTAGERVHRNLDLYGDGIVLGRPEDAAARLRDAAAVTGSMWPLPAGARTRLDRERHGHELAALLLRSNDPAEVERSLAVVSDEMGLGRQHGFRYVRAITSRRQGNLAAAASEFEALLNLLGDRPLPVDPPAEPPASDQPPVTQVASVFGDPARSLENVQLLHATALLEAGEARNALVQFGRQFQERDDRPFGPRSMREVCDRVVALDPQLPALIGGGIKPTTAVELRDYALACLYRRHYTKAASLFSQALSHPDYAKIPKPAGAPYDHTRYFAAAAAVRSGRAGDRDEPLPAVSEVFHKQAVGWMRDEAGQWHGVFGGSAAGVVQTYYWYAAVRHDHWLAVTRDKPLTDLLPADDRSEWKTFWDELDLRYGGLREQQVDKDGWNPF